MTPVKESRKVSHLVQYFEYLKLVDKLEGSVSRPNERRRPILGLATARIPEIDWCKGQLTAL